MISKQDREFLKKLYFQQLSFEDFKQKFSFKSEVGNLLKIAAKAGDEELLELSIVFYYHAGFQDHLCEILSQLLVETWHKQHAEIARVLQFEVICSESIEYLLKAIENRYTYLFEQDDYYPFVRKCVNAIRSIGGKKGKMALESLTEGTSDMEIKKLAMNQLAKI